MERHELAATIVGSGTVRSRHADAGFRNLCSPFHPWWHFRRVHPWVRNHVRPSSAREQLGRSITHVPHLT